jgi:HD-GYP domain-containing protein (c-di-GMP phosphodiesterase class II)
MLRITISHAQPGMVLALPVHRLLTSQVLLRTGFTLDSPTIAKLAQLQVGELWIEYPPTAVLRERISPALQQANAGVTQMMASLFDRVKGDACAALDFNLYRHSVLDLMETIRDDSDAAAFVVDIAGAGDCAARHAATVCFISLLLGMKLQGYLISQRKRLSPFNAKRVDSLGVGAMLHDLGLLHLPEEAQARYFAGHDEDDPVVQNHVDIGYQMVTGRIDPSAATVVFQHHQHYDGSGYPRRNEADPTSGIKGRNIHVLARITAVADQFDHRRHLADGSHAPRVKVLRDIILGSLSSWFDPVVLLALPAVCPPYSPGSVVGLSDGRRAVVMDWDPREPCRPTVQIMEDDATARRHRGEPEQIDLRAVKELEIVEQDGEPVAMHNFELNPVIKRLAAEGGSELEAA